MEIWSDTLARVAGRLVRRMMPVVGLLLASCASHVGSWEDWMEQERAAMEASPAIEPESHPAVAVPAGFESPYPFAEPYTHGAGATVGRGFDLSMRNPDFPRTFLQSVRIDLSNQAAGLTLRWSGPLAELGPVGPFRFASGTGKPGFDCNDVDVSNSVDSFCTPKGLFAVAGFSDQLGSLPSCHYATWVIHAPRYIALHSHTELPDTPASHGCVRLPFSVAKLIHNNSLAGDTLVQIEGEWTAPAVQLEM